MRGAMRDRYWMTTWTLALMVAALLALAPSVAAQQQRALVIGNADYTVSPLENPVNDATDMRAALERLGYETTFGVDLGADEMTRLIQEFQSTVRPNDRVVFYYAGHGIQLGGQNYLIPVNADLRSERDLESQAVQVSRIARSIEEMGVTQSLLVLDACRDNPFLSQSRGGTRGLSLATARTGSMVVYATAPGQVAFDGEGRNGLFTSALLRHIETPGIEVHDMVREVRADVANETDNRQIPFATSSITDPMYLASFERTDIQAQESRELFRLSVNTPFEGVEVYLNGELAGTTPLQRELPAGDYSLRLRHPDIAGVTRTVSARGGDQIPLRFDDLEPSLARELDPLVTRQELLLGQYDAALARRRSADTLAMASFNTALASGILAGGLGVATWAIYEFYYLDLLERPAWYASGNADVYQLREDLAGSIQTLRYATYSAAGLAVSAAVTSFVSWLFSGGVEDAVAAEIVTTDRRIEELGGGE